MAEIPSKRDAKTIISENKKELPAPEFNATAVEKQLAQARSKVQMLENRRTQLNQEIGEVGKELETAHKIVQHLDAAKAQILEVDRLKEKANGNG